MIEIATASFDENVKTMVWAMDEVSKESETTKEEYFEEYYRNGHAYVVTSREPQHIMFLVGKLAAAGHNGLECFRVDRFEK